MNIPKMNLTNISKSGYTFFAGIQPQKAAKLEKQAILDDILPDMKKFMCEIIDNEVPTAGKFKPSTLSCELPGSKFKAKFRMEYDAEHPEKLRRLSVGVHHANRDRIISEFLKTGTNDEITEYLKNENNAGYISDTVKNLWQKSEDYYNSL